MQKIIEGSIKPFKSTFDLRFYNNTIEEDYETENIHLRRVFGMVCAILTCILSAIEIYMDLIIRDTSLNLKFSFAITLSILILSLICFVMLFFISPKRGEYTFFVLLVNNILSTIIFLTMKISIKLKDEEITRNVYLYSFFFYFMNDIEYIFRIYYIFYFDNHFLRNMIANTIVILFSWLYTINYISYNKFSNNKQDMLSLLITFSIVMVLLTFLSYFKERNYRMLFLVKYDLLRRNEQSANLLRCMKCGLLVYNQNQEVYTNDYIRKYFAQYIFANYINIENNIESKKIIDESYNPSEIKEDERHMHFEKVEINNFMENLENINLNLPPEIKLILNLKQFSFKNFLLEIEKNRMFFKDFTYFGHKSLENQFCLEIFGRVKKNILNEYTIEFLFNDASRTKILEEVKQKEIFKKIFLAKTAHEFKNPLISIKEIIDQSYEYIKNTYFDGKSDLIENFSLVKSLVEFMLNLINDFSFLSAHDKLKSTIHISNVNLEKITKFCVSVTKSIISKSSVTNSKIKVSSQIDSNLPSKIITDEVKLKQILLNLLSNSVKFTKIGWIMMKLKKVSFNGKSYVKFIIIDTGTGIDHSISKNLFEEFTKTDKMNNIFGSGLGLSVVKELTNLLGTEIKYTRNEIKGLTKFHFCIELNHGGNGNENEDTFKTLSDKSKKLKSSFETVENKDLLIIPQKFKQKENGYFDNTGDNKPNIHIKFGLDICCLKNKLNLVVVDDDTLVRSSQVRMIKAFLKKRNIEAEFFEGEDGLECLYLIYTLLIQGKKIGYILMDETMKFLSGSSCAKIICKLTQMQIIPFIPVYIITAYQDKFNHDKILAKGVKKIISKPLINSKLDQIFEIN
jgi:signal transduction histidine kinase/CheY-like chemotaxis protein